jgi:hypothetical protein
MTARSTTTTTKEFSRLDGARRSLGCRQRPFVLIEQLEQSQQDLVVGDGRPGGGGLAVRSWISSCSRTCSMVAFREPLRACYLPNRGASVTRRELRCPVK